MTERTKRVYNILRALRDTLDNINLKMSHFLIYKGYNKYSIPYQLTQKTYITNIQQPYAGECNTSCCLAGAIPSVDWKWAVKHHMDFHEMSNALADTLHLKKDGKIRVLWTWLFSENWSSDKEWAKTRLNLVINEKKCYKLDFAIDYSKVNTMSEFLQVAFKTKEKELQHTYLLKGNKL